MAREYLLDHTSGVSTYLHYDAHTDETHVETVHDHSGVIDHVQRIQNESYDNMTPDREFEYVGEIPPVVIIEWLKMGFDLFTASGEELMAWINRHRREYGYLFVDRSKPYAGIIIKGSR